MKIKETYVILQTISEIKKNCVTLLDLCVSSLRRGHANLLCIVPILTDDLLGGSIPHCECFLDCV